MRRLLGTGLALALLLSAVPPYAHAAVSVDLQGERCQTTESEYCIYEDASLKANIASLTVIPRFYHMAQSCYLQAAMLTTINYYNNHNSDKKFTPGDTGVPTWTLDSFCTKDVKDGDRIINAHVKHNVELLYKDGSSSTMLETALANSQTSIQNNPDALLSSTNMGTPDRLVSDILWKEFFAYSDYLKTVQATRTPDDYQRGAAWAADKTRSQIAGDGQITSFLRGQIELLARIDGTVDKQIASTTRYVADILYTEFLRTYPEHLQYMIMQDHLRDIRQNVDRLQRAFETLGVKLPDAYIIGN